MVLVMCEKKTGIEYVAVDDVHYGKLLIIAADMRRNPDEVLDLFFAGQIDLRFSPEGSFGYTIITDFE